MTDSQKPDDVLASNELSLRALERAINRSRGRFSLFLVLCNYPTLRERMLQRLKDQYSVEAEILVVPKSARTLYTVIKNELGEQQPSALMVLGLETVVDLDDLLTATNNVRDEFRKSFTFPIVLWIDDGIRQKLIRLAPDFNTWGGVPILFEFATDQLIDLLKIAIERGFLGNLDQINFDPEAIQQDFLQRGDVLGEELQAGLDYLLGWDACRDNRLDLALTYCQRSLEYWQQCEEQKRQGIVLLQMASAYQQRAKQQTHQADNDWVAAGKTLQQAIALFEYINCPELTVQPISQLGLVLQRLRDWTALEALAHQAILLHQRHGTSAQLAQDYGFLTEVALARSQWAEACHFAQIAVQTIAEPSHERGVYYSLLAQAQQSSDQLEAAIASLKTAQVEVISQLTPQLYIRILERLRRLSLKQGEYLEAFRLKQTQRSVEQQYRFRAFVGAVRLQPQRQIKPGIEGEESSEEIAQEIATSGRQRDVDHLINNRLSAESCKLIIIHGQSGVGKSSTINAGLVPALRQHEVGILETVPVYIRAYSDWMQGLGQALAEEMKKLGDEVESLQDFQFSTLSLISQLKINERRNRLTILIFDQFEEFFFVCTNQQARLEFWEFLRICIEGRESGAVKIVLSLREDYLHYLLELERLSKVGGVAFSSDALSDILNKQNRYALGNFSSQDAESIISSLTKNAQFQLEAALVTELVQDLARSLGEVRPIELQVVGSQLQTDHITTLEQYRQLGANPKEVLVERFLQEVIEDCGTINERAARVVLYLLTDENNTRPLKTRAELVADLSEEADKLDLVLEIFVETGLVFLLRESPANRYQLVHDYLVSFIRQQQGPGLLAELAQEREQRQQAETQFDLKQKELNLKQEELEQAKQATITLQKENQLLQQDSKRVSEDIKKGQKTLKKTGRQLSLVIVALLLGLVGLGKIVPQTLQASSAAENSRQEAENFQQAAENSRQEAENSRQEAENFQLNLERARAAEASAKLEGAMVTQQATQKINQAEQEASRKTNQAERDAKQKIDQADTQAKKRINEAETQRASIEKEREKAKTEAQDLKVNTLLSSSDPVTGLVLAIVAVESSSKMSPKVRETALASLRTAIKTAREEYRLTVNNGKIVTSIAASHDGNIIVAASEDGSLWQWDKQEKSVAKRIYGSGKSINAVAMSTDGKILVFGGEDKKIQWWDLENSRNNKSFLVESFITSLSINWSGKIAAIGTENQGTFLWKEQDKKPTKLPNPPDQGSINIRAVAISPDGKLIASADEGTEGSFVRIWDEQGNRQGKDDKRPSLVNAVAFDPKNQFIISAGDDAVVQKRSLDVGGRIKSWGGHTKLIRSVGVSNDGKFIVSAGADDTVRVWTEGDRPSITLRGHKKAINSVAFIRGGEAIVSGSDDGTVRIWNSQPDSSFEDKKIPNAKLLAIACSRFNNHPISKFPNKSSDLIRAKSICQNFASLP